MSPKEYAKDLINKMGFSISKKIDTITNEETPYHKNQFAKECALICVDQIIPIVEGYEESLSISQQSDNLEYWKEIKKEIKKY